MRAMHARLEGPSPLAMRCVPVGDGCRGTAESGRMPLLVRAMTCASASIVPGLCCIHVPLFAALEKSSEIDDVLWRHGVFLPLHQEFVGVGQRLAIDLRSISSSRFRNANRTSFNAALIVSGSIRRE